MTPALDLELINTFLTICETKGFKSAAVQLNKTPAAISFQIKRLEDILGKKILERNNQGISLTTSGELLKEKGKKMMLLNYELLGDLRENELCGPLNFGAPADYAPTLLKKLLPIFLREFPKVSPNITLEPSRVLRSRIKAGTLDMAIVAREPETNEGQRLWTEEVSWYGKTHNDDDIFRVGLLATDCVLRDQALKDLKVHGNNYDLVVEAATVASLRDAVEAGFCHAFLPTSIASGLQLCESPSPTTILNLPFCLIVNKRFDEKLLDDVTRKIKRVLID